MDSVSSDEILQWFSTLFSEAFLGSPPTGSWFSDPGPSGALFGTLETIDAALASRGTPSIAAHVEHVRWFLALTNAYIRGEQPDSDWEKSWTVTTVDDMSWAKLRADLRAEYDAAASGIAENRPWTNPEYTVGIVALLPHVAYHLGAIRALAYERKDFRG